MQGLGRLSQEQIVFGLAVLLCVGFALALPGFLTTNNLLNLVRSVSILGILGVAMGLVVIGRGIDLSLVALMAISVAWTLHADRQRHAAAAGDRDRARLQPLHRRDQRLARRLCRDPGDLRDARHGHAGLRLRPLLPVRSRRRLHAAQPASRCCGSDRARFLGVPVPIFLFAGVCLAGYLLPALCAGADAICAPSATTCWPRASPAFPRGRSIVLQYVLSSLIGYMAGIVTAASVASMNTRVAISTYVYDVILVVVLGGIGLSGGKGGIRNVIVGTLLIGVLLNGMTIMDIQYTRPERHQGRHPADRDRHRHHRQPPRRADRSAGGHLSLFSKGGNIMKLLKTGYHRRRARSVRRRRRGPGRHRRSDARAVLRRRSPARRSPTCRWRWAST